MQNPLVLEGCACVGLVRTAEAERALRGWACVPLQWPTAELRLALTGGVAAKLHPIGAAAVTLCSRLPARQLSLRRMHSRHGAIDAQRGRSST